MGGDDTPPPLGALASNKGVREPPVVTPLSE